MGDDGEGCAERAHGPDDEDGGYAKAGEGGGPSASATVEARVRHLAKKSRREDGEGEEGSRSDWRACRMAHGRDRLYKRRCRGHGKWDAQSPTHITAEVPYFLFRRQGTSRHTRQSLG